MELEKQQPNKPGENRNPNGTFGKNNNANPKGRPKGQTLKEWVREQLIGMNDKQRKEFLKGISKDIQWKMAEGNPESKTDVTSGGEVIPILVQFVDAKNNTDTPRIQEPIQQ